MTVTAPPAPVAPSVRSVRQWAIAVTQSLGCTALGFLFFLINFGMLLEEFSDSPPEGLLAMYGVDALVGVAATLVIGPLRFVPPGRWHSVVHLLVAAAAGISGWAWVAAAIGLYRLGVRRRLLLDGVAVLLVAGMSLTAMVLDARTRGIEPGMLELTTMGIIVVLALIPLLLGHVVGTRAELLTSLREHASSADREREAAQQAREAAEREAAALVRERDADDARVRAEERSALARDMHDSISHHLATIAMHAGAMSYRDDLPVAELRRSAGTVRDAAQQANRELRTVLMTLRTTGGDTPLATVPTLTDIVERCRTEGQHVELSWHDVAPEELEDADRSTVVTLARILTEITTNAAKHAPGAPLAITLSRSGDTVHLHASNPLPASALHAPTSTGHGLLGIQERARLLGGDAEHRVQEDSFEVEAWMPW
ncbi:sensor histidine kinase [Brachybacterium tyrofermentans]|uniref:sensor histidine kinase n=1 Tax=Brachybacterium tyrofermentans TaxID=47848 RepID=UPI003FD00C08